MTAGSVKEFIDLVFGYSQAATISLEVYVIMILSIVLFLLIKEMWYSRQGTDKEFHLFRFMSETLISIVLSILILVLIARSLFGDELWVAVLMSIGVGITSAALLYKRWVAQPEEDASHEHDGKISIEILNNGKHEDMHYGEADIKKLTDEFGGLKDDGVTHLDILDILVLYGYISNNQRERLIESCIFEDPKDMVSKLLNMQCLTPSELDEARVIMNLSKLRGRRITKEEAVQYILSKRKDRGEGSEES